MHRTTPWYRAQMDAVYPTGMREQVLTAVAAGVPLDAAMETLGLPDEVAYGRARRDTGFRNRLYQALMDGRDSALNHGKRWTYAHYRCRCPECQATQPQCTAARRWLELYAYTS
ncbi:hypothetical protein [Nonomuraea sp. KM90]|uniref:hypothetical protein n=1 Tax=Nonomuraea sp. KM90 TaxID=3457428 RepID=UPI003FCD37E0